MKLTLCVPLIWKLFSSAEALKCVQKYQFSTDKKDPEPCNSPDVHCATVAYLDSAENPLDFYLIRRACAPSSLCVEGNQSFSMSFGDYRMTSSLQCCSTDGCNNKPIHYPDEQKPNGLQCFTRYPGSESELVKLQCGGIEDRCIVVNKTDRGRTSLFHGCASANLCEGDTELKLRALIDRSISGDEKRFSDLECCGSSLCNSAPADKLSVISLLLALVALSVR